MNKATLVPVHDNLVALSLHSCYHDLSKAWNTTHWYWLYRVFFFLKWLITILSLRAITLIRFVKQHDTRVYSCFKHICKCIISSILIWYIYSRVLLKQTSIFPFQAHFVGQRSIIRQQCFWICLGLWIQFKLSYKLIINLIIIIFIFFLFSTSLPHLYVKVLKRLMHDLS